MGVKGYQEQAKKTSATLPLPLLGVPQNYQANNYNIYAEDLVHTCEGSVVASLVPVKSYDPSLVDSLDCVLMGSSILSGLFSLFLNSFHDQNIWDGATHIQDGSFFLSKTSL